MKRQPFLKCEIGDSRGDFIFSVAVTLQLLRLELSQQGAATSPHVAGEKGLFLVGGETSPWLLRNSLLFSEPCEKGTIEGIFSSWEIRRESEGEA